MEKRLSITTETAIVRGIVAVNEDPEFRGRLKIRIPSYHGIPNVSRSWINDTDLPWATPGLLISAGNDVGQRLIPTVGTRIFVLFEDGDLSRPIYLGGIPQLIGDSKYYNSNDTSVLGGELEIVSNDTMSDFDPTNSQASQGVLFKSLKGFTIYYNDTNGNENVKIVDQSGQSIKMRSLEPVNSRRGSNLHSTVPSQVLISSGDTQLQIGNSDLTSDVIGAGKLGIDTVDSSLVINDAFDGFIFILPSDILGD